MFDKYIDVILEIGLNLQPGERLHNRGQASDWKLIHRITEKAYEKGASFVSVEWEDNRIDSLALLYGDEERACTWPAWKNVITKELLDTNACVLSLRSPFANEVEKQPPIERIMRRQRSKATANDAFNTRVLEFDLRYCIATAPNPAWAKKVFPTLDEDEALQKLWEAVLHCSYADLDDPVAFWRRKQQEAIRRCRWMNEQEFDAVHFIDPHTDLTVGLPPRHIWLESGVKCSSDGVFFLPNVPSEENGSVPLRSGVDGTVRLSKPLVYQEMLIEGATLRFEHGKVTAFDAERGREALAEIIHADENACYLGEVAIVPENSAIGETGLIYYTTLFDENTSCHIALGESFPYEVGGMAGKSREEQIAAGINRSSIHVDMMIGTKEMKVYGLKNGKKTLLLADGDWQI